MSEYIPSDQPIFTIEGRMGQSGQTFKETRAGALATLLGKEGIATVYVDVQSPDTYDNHGFIKRAGIANGEHIEYHGLDEPLAPDAWRLRDVTWQDGDPTAYTSGRGYNTQAARMTLATNAGMIWAMEDMGLRHSCYTGRRRYRQRTGHRSPYLFARQPLYPPARAGPIAHPRPYCPW